MRMCLGRFEGNAMLTGTRPLLWIWAFAAAHAAMFALSMPPFDLWMLALIAPAPLAWLAIVAPSTRSALAASFICILIMWLVLLRWIVPVTAVGYPALTVYLSLWATLFTGLVRRIALHPKLGRLPMTIVLPVIWTAVEFARGDLLFDGYPWYLLAHPLIEALSFVQSADLFGAYFISFLAAMSSGLIVDALRPLADRDRRRRTLVVGGATLIVVYAANFIYGTWRLNQRGVLFPGPRVLAIQTNLPQDNKIGWSREQQERDVPAFMELTRRAFEAAEPKPDLIVWPETMVPGMGFDPQTLENLSYFSSAQHYIKWPRAVMTLSEELNAPLLVGSEAWINTSIEPDDENPARMKLAREFTYNSAFLIQPRASLQRYDKFFLTPFGETMPYISAWPWLERQLLTLGVGADLSFNLDSNPKIELLEVKINGRDIAGAERVTLATPICFEDTVARLCRRMAYAGGVKRIDLFVNISNDGWFSFSHADRKLHAQIAQFRSIENRVPMVRSVNTGMSVAIDSAGRLFGAAGGGKYGVAQREGSVLADVQLDSRSTLYGQLGELWPLVCLGATVLGIGWTFATRRKANR